MAHIRLMVIEPTFPHRYPPTIQSQSIILFENINIIYPRVDVTFFRNGLFK